MMGRRRRQAADVTVSPLQWEMFDPVPQRKGRQVHASVLKFTDKTYLSFLSKPKIVGKSDILGPLLLSEFTEALMM